MDENLTQKNRPFSGNNKNSTEQNQEYKLREVLQGIIEARIKDDNVAEASLCKKAQTVYGEITEENLIEKSRKLALEEVAAEGFKIVQKKNVSSGENFNNELEKFKLEQQFFALQKGWTIISDAERKSYENNPNVFISKTEQKRQDLTKKGLNISKEIFYNMIASGYMFSDLRKSALSGKIKLPVLLGDGVYKFSSMSEKEFANLIELLQSFFDMIAKKTVEDRLNKKLVYSKRRWHERKMRKIRELLQAAIEDIEWDKKTEELVKQKVQEQLEAEHKKEEMKDPGIREAEALKKLKKFEDEERKVEKELKKELDKMEKRLAEDLIETAEDQKTAGNLARVHKKIERIDAKKEIYVKAIKFSKKEKKEPASDPSVPEPKISAPESPVAIEEKQEEPPVE